MLTQGRLIMLCSLDVYYIIRDVKCISFPNVFISVCVCVCENLRSANYRLQFNNGFEEL